MGQLFWSKLSCFAWGMGGDIAFKMRFSHYHRSSKGSSYGITCFHHNFHSLLQVLTSSAAKNAAGWMGAKGIQLIGKRANYGTTTTNLHSWMFKMVHLKVWVLEKFIAFWKATSFQVLLCKTLGGVYIHYMFFRNKCTNGKTSQMQLWFGRRCSLFIGPFLGLHENPPIDPWNSP